MVIVITLSYGLIFEYMSSLRCPNLFVLNVFHRLSDNNKIVLFIRITKNCNFDTCMSQLSKVIICCICMSSALLPPPATNCVGHIVPLARLK
jgi:hypothetical protein